MKPVADMTDDEIVGVIFGDSLMNRLRKIISHGAARIEQAQAQRRPPGPTEVRRMELTIVEKIAKEVGIDL